MKYEELTHKIIGCAYNVYNQLGFGFLESIYQKSLVIELRKNDVKVEAERSLKVYYDDHIVGDYFIDLFIENTVVVELKSVDHLSSQNEVQLVNYLSGLKKDIGLLINFGPSGVDVKRKYRFKQKSEKMVIDQVMAPGHTYIWRLIRRYPCVYGCNETPVL